MIDFFGFNNLSKIESFRGVPSEIEDFKEVVMVLNDSSNLSGASGVLISSCVVLTAAHNIDSGYTDRVFVGNNINGKGEFFDVDKIIPHPDYASDTHENDIAIYLLNNKIIGLPLVRFSTKSEVEDALNFLLVGYGYSVGLSGETSLPGIQYRVDLKKRINLLADHHSYEFLAGDKFADSCRGDSGGPLFILKEGDGRKSIAGIALRGLSGAPCGGGGGVYLNVSYFADWIHSIMIKYRF